MSKTKELTDKERIKDAEARVGLCQEALDEAEDNLRDAEAELKSLERKIMAEFVAAHTGPQQPIGDRIVRHSCAVSEIPAEFANTMGRDAFRCLVGKGGDSWVTNGYFMIRADDVGALDRVPCEPSAAFGKRTSPLARRDAPSEVGGVWCRHLGPVAIQLKFAALVEGLFPGVEWYASGGELDPAHAVVDGVLVAVVMPVRQGTAFAA